MTDMEAWNKRIAPRLNDIEYSSNAIARHARYIQQNSQYLPCRPAWETKARDSLNEAERKLRVALAVVKTAQIAYDNLPVTA